MAISWTDEVRRLATEERERNERARPYVGLSYLNDPTDKQTGSPIIGTDTVKGCRNNCFRCYANRLSRFHSKVFAEPVLCFVVGIPDPEIVYRFGTFGDPAANWDWTFRELARLRARGLKRFYVLTKLQTVDGFRNDPELCLQVTFDPLNGAQLKTTMRNFDAVVASRVIRLKSIRSGHDRIMLRQAEVLSFAEERGAPILETRFYTHVREDLGLLLMHGYRRKGKLFKYPGSVLKDCFGLEGHRVCDRANTGKCHDCLNCLTYLK